MGVIDNFVNKALEHKGEHGDWSWSTSGLGRGQPWCAAFICAIAKTQGILGKLIYESFACTTMFRGGVENNLGSYIAGPAWGGHAKPQKGDIIFYVWNGRYDSKYGSDHVGIVVSCDDSKVTTIEGNTNGLDNWSNVVGSHDYSLQYECICGYFRPNWGETPLGGGKLYDSESTEEDATVREVCYSDLVGEPSISPTAIKLSVINYTSGLVALVSGSNVSGGEGDANGLDNENARVIYKFLVGKGLTDAQACGILGNIRWESSFNPASVNSIGASGICQWLGGRCTAMKQHCGSNWASNLSGQCDFLWYELNSSENATLVALQEVTSNTVDSAVRCCDIFFQKFERAGDSSGERRQNAARDYFNDVMGK